MAAADDLEGCSCPSNTVRLAMSDGTTRASSASGGGSGTGFAEAAARAQGVLGVIVFMLGGEIGLIVARTAGGEDVNTASELSAGT